MKKNQLEEVAMGYLTQMKLNKIREKDEVTLEEISTFRKQCLIFLISILQKIV